MYRAERFKRTVIKIAIVAAVLAVLFGGLYYVMSTHTIRTVYVEGNVHYTEEEIKALVMEGMLGDNSLYLALKYKNRGVEDVPFLDAMDVTVLSPDTIKITVYEKALAGYVEYMDTFVYFDKDGYAVESSSVRTMGVPLVTGLSFDYMVLGRQLPVKEGQSDVFTEILNLTKLLRKYSLSADKIYFQPDSNISIYFGNVRVALGNESDKVEDKLMLLPEILQKLDAKSGTLQMETYSERGGYTFKPE